MRPNCSQKRTEKDSNCVFLQLFNFFVCVLWVYPSIRHRSLPEMLHLERKSFIHRSSSLQRSYLSLVCVFLTFNNAKFLWIFPACSFSLCHQLINFYNLSGSPRSFVPVFFYYVLDVDGGHSYFKFYKSYILFSLWPKLFFVCAIQIDWLPTQPTSSF